MSFLKHSVLALRILLWVLLAAFAVFLLTTGIGVALERNKALTQAHDEAQNAVTNNLGSISLAVWNYDQAALSALLQGMTKVTSIARLELSDHNRVIADVRDPLIGNQTDRVWSVSIPAPDGKSQIGTLKITESYEDVDRKITGMMRNLIAGELVKIIGLAFILFAIVYRKVARHLHNLAEDVIALDPSNLGSRVALHREKFNAYRDELDILVESINRFLAERAEELKKRTKAESSLREHLSEIEATLGALSDGVIALDRGCRVRYANGAARSLLGMSFNPVGELCLDQLLNVIDERTGTVLDSLCQSVIRDHAPIHLRGNVRIRTPGGVEFDSKISAVPVPAEGDVAVIFVFTDISAEISKERQIEFQAFHDPLTQLGNRALLARDLPREIEQATRKHGRLAVLCIDLDNFKNINDALGHTIGDQLLQQLALRFRKVCVAPIWVTRHGGDEFIVVVPNLTDLGRAAETAEALMRSIAEPFQIGAHELRVTSSIGISIFPDHGAGIGELVSNADMAMYEAKREGRNTCRYYESAQLQRSTERLAMENGLRVAIAEKEFSLAFQPKVRLEQRQVDSMEALLRWNSARAGSVPPGTFIPIAEDTGLIIEIGDWVLRESLAAARRFRSALGRDLAIAVNVSPVQFRSEKLFDTLTELAAGEPDLPRLLEIELTESALGGNVAEVITKLQRIKALGVKIAIDDFGTGYSSLAYLKNFPIDILKIDQAFIRDLHVNPQDKAIVASVVQLGKSLGFELVAEGVEEPLHVDILTELGCDVAQGYWFARPVAEQDVPQALTTIKAMPGNPG